MRNDMEANFLSTNKELLTLLRKALNESFSDRSEELWQSPEIVKEILLEDLESLISTYSDRIPVLAKYQVGLAKYFDFFYLGWTKHERSIQDVVKKIVNLALKIVSNEKYLAITVKCGCHDDACFKHPLGPRYRNEDLTHRDEKNRVDWPILPKEEAANFEKSPTPVILSKGAHLYRIISKNRRPKGSWWFYDMTLINRPMWRSLLAVRKQWNANEFFVYFHVPFENGLTGWEGRAASQQAEEDCILLGGYRQLWISPDTLKEIDLQIYEKIVWPLHTQN